MNLLDRIKGAFGQRAAQLTYDQIADLIDGSGARTVAGMTVTPETALQVSTVLACVKVICDGVATPDLHVYRDRPGDGRRELATNIGEYRLLARRPNEFQTSFQWRRMMTLHAALCGAGVSLIVRGGNGRVRELIPLVPGKWDVRQTSRYVVRYRCWDEFGFIGEFDAKDVFVIHNLQWDMIKPLNAVLLAKQSIGLAMAAEASHVAAHANGVKTSGVYAVDGTLTAEAHERLLRLMKQHQGADNAGKPFILDRNAKWVSSQMSGVDAQHVETRRLQIEQICSCFGVFPLMIGYSDKTSTFASSEAFFAAHVKHTLAPWHKEWTQKLDEFLLDGSGPLWAGFDTRYLLAGSMSDRAAWSRTMVEMGIYTRNEIRDEEGLDPLPGLNEPLTPMNMTQGSASTTTTAPTASQD